MTKIAGSWPRVASFTFPAVALGANDDILADTAMDETEDTIVTEFDGQPDVARNVTVKGNDANVSGDVVIVGTRAGAEITETLALNAANVVAGDKAFDTITEITLPPYDTANTERVRVGLGAKIGLPVALSRNTVLAAFLDGAREGTAPTIAFSASALESNTATLNSALDGSDVIVDLYETL
ncbi:hypothetical protein K1W69_17460 [Hoeflea sp. WL0058]|uniref:Uncharacterized protein n=1 Tax=Flavimaribacter sediminis TaxID=2865987 RepID=A0AAE2ZLY6_9HYPH|nr:hypothetical protein [Flavimaribacter sediminis]MBW8638988.1 hypothetical protein [Flavimaribacter sediminis]